MKKIIVLYLLSTLGVIMHAQCKGFNKNLKVTTGQAVKCLSVEEFLQLCKNSTPLKKSTFENLSKIAEIAKQRGDYPLDAPEEITLDNYLDVIKKYAVTINVTGVHTYDCYDSVSGLFGTWKRPPYEGEYGLEIFKMFFKSLACANSVMDYSIPSVSMRKPVRTPRVLVNTKTETVYSPPQVLPTAPPALALSIKKTPIDSVARVVKIPNPITDPVVVSKKQVQKTLPDDTVHIPGKKVVIHLPGEVEYKKGDKVVIQLPTDTVYEKTKVFVESSHFFKNDTFTQTNVIHTVQDVAQQLDYYDERNDAVTVIQSSPRQIETISSDRNCCRVTASCGSCNQKDILEISSLRERINNLQYGTFSKNINTSTHPAGHTQPYPTTEYTDDVYHPYVAPTVPVVSKKTETTLLDEVW